MAKREAKLPLTISPQFNAYAVSEKRLLLLSEERSFQLTGKLYVEIANLMDGQRTYGDIVTALKPGEPVKRIRYALDNMLEKKYAAYVHPEARTPA